jgi:hypothetical protein
LLSSSKIPHSQSGYSWSSFAIGGSLPFRYPSPFKGVPAGTELFGAAGSDGDAWGTPVSPFGVNGFEKGCAAPVEVAAGGPSCAPLGGPLGAAVVVEAYLMEVEASRLGYGRAAWEVKRKAHLWQIMVAKVKPDSFDPDIQLERAIQGAGLARGS